jgi:CIC family chloride channel protein
MNLWKRLRRAVSPQQLVRRSVETRYALAEACLIGIISALAALLLKQGIGSLGWLRLQMANSMGAWVALPLFGLVLGFISGWWVERFAPAAAGGGIPQVKAVLAQYPMPLSLRVAVVKLVGTILVLGAGLTLGRRGPTVHIGAALAAQLSRWVPTAPEHRRRMIAAGAAAGLAAGFNTPIAGVMFVIEELMRDVSNLTLETAILASFTGAVVSRVLDSADLNLPDQMLDPTLQTSFSATEIPFFLLLGILAGLLGGGFNRGIIWARNFNNRLKLPMSVRVGMAGLISGMVVAVLPPFFQNNAGLREFLVTGEAGWQTTAIAFAAHFLLTLLAYGSGAPGGLFAPALVLGSALGFLVGAAEVTLMGSGSTITYALTGMGAFFTAVVRVPVTAIVIVFEITADFELVLPLMLACAMAYIVGEWVYKGSIYQHLLASSDIELQEGSDSNRLLENVRAMDVMQRKVETLSSQTTVAEARQAFSNSQIRGFPVTEEGKLVGIITQTDMAKLTARPGDLPLTEIMTPQPVTVKPNTSLSHVLYVLDRYQLAHLPVIQGSRLVGIITRTDIIRAEADLLSGKIPQGATKAESSYVVYSTRGGAVGKGRVLLPLANPENADRLLQMAGAIAQYHDYELECLQVITIPRHSSPSQAQVNTLKYRRTLRHAEKVGKDLGISVHTQIRLAYSTAEAILEVIREHHIDLILMGWKGNTSTPGRIFGGVVDTVVRQAGCDVMVVRLAEDFPLPELQLRPTWLIPIAGGPNAQRAIELLPALLKFNRPLAQPTLWLTQVHPPQEVDADYRGLEQTAQSLREKLEIPIATAPLRAHSVADGIIRLIKSEHCDVVIVGASREGLLQQTVKGNIPDMIARSVKSTVILVRSAQD